MIIQLHPRLSVTSAACSVSVCVAATSRVRVRVSRPTLYILNEVDEEGSQDGDGAEYNNEPHLSEDPGV